MFELKKIRECLDTKPDILVAYLFGSGVSGEEIVNDLDILIFADEKANRLKIQLELVSNLSKLTGLTAHKIDIVFFDQEEVDLNILRNAINHGILLKNIAPELLSDRIGKLSKYFLRNEPVMLNAKRLEKERLEAFCEG